MSEYTPNFAPAVVLLFLGTIFITGTSLLILFYGALRRSKILASLGGIAAVIVIVGYAVVLTGVSAVSSAKVLPPGGWKYFCEVDCHIAYSVQSARTAAALGTELQQTGAKGQFIIVQLKTWFDESTISPHRGNSPLQTGKRMVVLADDAGHAYEQSPAGEAALRLIEGAAAPLDQPLRPGESFVMTLVFDVPKDASGLRLLVTDKSNDWVSRLIIGHEDSFLHKKIYLGLAPIAADPSATILR
jgi:Domain of unknown function (DUF4352)